MGEVITKNAAVDDILSDVKTSLDRGVLRGGVWKEEAEKRLAPIMTVVGTVEAQLGETKKTLAPLEWAATLADEQADATLHRVHDEAWNLLGRPANDPLFLVIYPQGAGGLADDDRAGQPGRMDLVAKLFRSKVHPGIPPEKSTEYATAIAADAQALRRANEVVAGPRADVAQLERVKKALASAGRVELARYKRHLLAQGISETDVHTVIPDRPRSAGGTKAKEPAAPTE